MHASAWVEPILQFSFCLTMMKATLFCRKKLKKYLKNLDELPKIDQTRKSSRKWQVLSQNGNICPQAQVSSQNGQIYPEKRNFGETTRKLPFPQVLSQWMRGGGSGLYRA